MFLLRRKGGLYMNEKFLFTFQYVSIKTQIDSIKISDIRKFTFQYVSIKTNQRDGLKHPAPPFTFQYVSIKT